MPPKPTCDSGARTERPWGWFETVCEQPGSKIKRIGVHPGQQISLQRHRHRSEHWVVLRGVACVTIDATERELRVGAHVHIGLSTMHRLANRTAEPMEIVEVQFGEILDEDDIERLQDDYGRV